MGSLSGSYCCPRCGTGRVMNPGAEGFMNSLVWRCQTCGATFTAEFIAGFDAGIKHACNHGIKIEVEPLFSNDIELTTIEAKRNGRPVTIKYILRILESKKGV